ncbi:carboxypeptidase-like regulatory domain-containing protein [Solirubrum puertoriconensis]|uniref:Carboxypeptidase-like regulatory domain-containing protein n=1 Tax=Solirubrum puertoriconensis TaxID=1751427 RepID=A0A9X0HKN6_SOLP1|nr:carboxypeptidase-like regulatory domain-containing protein [Solirubrum puertoriconensis]KUG07708.1 hypothetical protein ASU33_15430 [Solirubrum puertoriconensis]
MIIAWLKHSSLLYALLSCVHVSPQQPQPHVLDARIGEAVPFASVGVKLKPVGTVADAEGQFSLKALAAALPSDTVVVTCVGYAPRKLLLSQLLQEATVHLTPLTQELSTVTIRATGWKRRRVGHDGSFSLTHYNFHLNNDTEPARKLGREVGAVLRIRPQSEIEDVHFYIGQNTFRGVRLRLNVRALDTNENPTTSLLTQDVHYVLPDDAKGWQHLDLRPYHIATGNHNRVAVTLEWLEGMPDPQRSWQTLLMPAPLGPMHRMVYRDKSADEWHSLRASLSLYVTAASPTE